MSCEPTAHCCPLFIVQNLCQTYIVVVCVSIYATQICQNVSRRRLLALIWQLSIAFEHEKIANSLHISEFFCIFAAFFVTQSIYVHEETFSQRSCRVDHHFA